jgi:uncharacterized protein (DUF2384 family)
MGNVMRVESLQTTPLPFEPSSVITDEEAGAMLRAATNLFGLWKLSDKQAAILLDVPTRTYARWKSGGKASVGRDLRTRLSNLMGIHKALRIVFREPQRGYDWVHAPNSAFGDKSALEVMLGGELTDLMRVRRDLDSERGGW